MNNKQISGKQMQCMMIMFLLGSAFIVGAISKARQDTWITIIIGSIMTIPMILVYSALVRKYPGENLFEIIVKIFGKIIGKVVCILYVLFFLHLGSMVIKTFAEYIHLLNMPETPQIFIICIKMLLLIWAVKSGVGNMGKIGKFTFPILAIFTFITVAIAFKVMNFSNTKPMLSTDIKIIVGSSFTTFMLPFGELVLFITLFPCVKSKSSPTKIYLKSLIVSTLILVIANLRNLLILGVPSEKLFYFPSYQAISILSISEIFTRMEVLVGASVLLAGFVKACICLYVSSVGLAKVCNIKNYKTMIAPSGLIIVTLSTIVFSNTEDMFKWITYHQFYVIPFEVLLPILLLVTDFIKTRIKKSTTPLKSENIGNLE